MQFGVSDSVLAFSVVLRSSAVILIDHGALIRHVTNDSHTPVCDMS